MDDLGVPENPRPILQKYPKIGDLVHRVCPHKRLLPYIKEAFPNDWKSANIEGKVLQIDGQKTWWIEWTIGTAQVKQDHGVQFWTGSKKRKSTASASSNSGPGLAPSNGGLEPVGDGEGMDADDGNEEGPSEVSNSAAPDSVIVKMGDDNVTWDFLPNGVTICPRASQNLPKLTAKVI